MYTIINNSLSTTMTGCHSEALSRYSVSPLSTTEETQCSGATDSVLEDCGHNLLQQWCKHCLSMLYKWIKITLCASKQILTSYKKDIYYNHIWNLYNNLINYKLRNLKPHFIILKKITKWLLDSDEVGFLTGREVMRTTSLKSTSGPWFVLAL